ncbi:MAG: sugar phosphate isomerase/epimerase family protein [Bordetella sp.]|uniref:sugar phosphate isomerase/epimerase family protein n=1 Tax=Bordetella sp. TaxID=28081 RepID=UPI003F7CA799
MHMASSASQTLISLTSFGAAEVLRHGQLWFARLSQAAGADGVEVREELLRDAARELPELAAWAREASHDGAMAVVYSCPQPLYDADGARALPTLQHAIATSQRLGAGRLKMSIGGFSARSGGFDAIGHALKDAGIALLIENDQTASAGTVLALECFFAAADAAGLRLPMTFDIGNWAYQGECALQAAQRLRGRVGYVHAKGVQRLPAKWVAVPLTESALPWRATLCALPDGAPRAIEYPLVGDDLEAVTRRELQTLRAVHAQSA